MAGSHAKLSTGAGVGRQPTLGKEEAEAHQRQTPDWVLRDDAQRIERTFRFKNFAEAFGFVQQASDLAESEGHHPDICFGWGYATVSLQTKKIGIVTSTLSGGRVGACSPSPRPVISFHPR
jgi:pterin-4a-carbinolamine dehydratase